MALLLVLILIPLSTLGAEPTALYGQHFPHGAAAVDYVYGSNGMWRDQTGVRYAWAYYDHCETPSHTADLVALITYGATWNVTSPDPHCLLLGDMNDDGDIADESPTGFAFHEHSGKGPGGRQAATPFYHFWFDDNWLASYMAAVYRRPQPSGLHDHDHPVRWRLLWGDNSHWTPYAPSEFFDRIALNGLYKLNADDFDGALAEWSTLKAMSGWTYNWEDQRFDYPAIRETYYLALWAILSERLLASSGNFWQRHDVLQHAMALRSHLLSLQERDAAGNRLGWITGIGNEKSLINTETLSLAVLALGAGATWVLEPGHSPLWSAQGNYFARPHNALSAVVGLSRPGHIVYGPYWNVPAGRYAVDFSLRTPSNAPASKTDNRLATVDVYDGKEIVAIASVSVESMPGRNEWLRQRMTVDVKNPENLIEFRVWWHGQVNLDVGPVRVTRLDDDSPLARSAVFDAGPKAKAKAGASLASPARLSGRPFE